MVWKFHRFCFFFFLSCQNWHRNMLKWFIFFRRQRRRRRKEDRMFYISPEVNSFIVCLNKTHLSHIHNYLWCYDYKTITVFNNENRNVGAKKKHTTELTFHALNTVQTVFVETLFSIFSFFIFIMSSAIVIY